MALDKYFPSEEGVRIIAEPGRYFVASAYTLGVNIIAKRVVSRDQQGESKLPLCICYLLYNKVKVSYLSLYVIYSIQKRLFCHCLSLVLDFCLTNSLIEKPILKKLTTVSVHDNHGSNYFEGKICSAG